MRPLVVFRASVLLSLVVPICGLVYSIAATPHFSQDWQDLLAWSGDSAIILPDSDSDELSTGSIVAVVGFCLFVVIALANQVAFFFCWGPSRRIALWLTGLGFGFSPFLGLTVAPPLELAAYELGAMFGGASLALAYFSPVSQMFEDRRRTLQKQVEQRPHG